MNSLQDIVERVYGRVRMKCIRLGWLRRDYEELEHEVLGKYENTQTEKKNNRNLEEKNNVENSATKLETIAEKLETKSNADVESQIGRTTNLLPQTSPVIIFGLTTGLMLNTSPK